MSATYGISTYGKEFLVEEGTREGSSPLRYLYIAINVLLWVGQTAYLSHRFIALRAALRPLARRRQVANAIFLLNFSFIAFTINNILRSTHMVDHIFRPVYYHEPKWAYAKILITEMEVPTYANVLMAVLAIQGMTRLLDLISQGTRQGHLGAFVFMGLYILGSLFNLVHYTIEPPTNYGIFANFNIAGTAITNLPIIYCLVKTYLAIPTDKSAPLLVGRPEDGTGVRSSGRKRAPVDRLSY